MHEVCQVDDMHEVCQVDDMHEVCQQRRHARSVPSKYQNVVMW